MIPPNPRRCGLRREQFAERGQRCAAGLHDEHIARRSLADRLQDRQEFARRHDRVRRPTNPCGRGQRPDARIDDRQRFVDVAECADRHGGKRVHA